jgi:hypothetical protein
VASRPPGHKDNLVLHLNSILLDISNAFIKSHANASKHSGNYAHHTKNALHFARKICVCYYIKNEQRLFSQAVLT